MRIKSFMIITILLFVLASCATKPVRTVETPPSKSLGPIVYGDAKLLKVAKEIPNFGGMFYDDRCILNVFLVEDIQKLSKKSIEDRTSRIKEAILNVYGESFFSIGCGRKIENENTAQKVHFQINLKEGDFTIDQLAKWRTDINQLLELPSVVYTDLDEGSNRVKIGILSTADRAKIRAEIEKMGIPSEAVIMKITSPFKFGTTLKNKFRPVPGAVQIEADTGFFTHKQCTMGFNADRNCIYGFVTCSHCTKRRGGTGSNTDFHQPEINEWSWLPWVNSNKVGDEMIDPAYFSGGACPAGRRCRYSDSAFIEYDRKRYLGNDEIAATHCCNNGSLTIDNSNPRKHIVLEWSNTLVGQVANKIGRTTGWTHGRISATCVKGHVEDTDITLLCQDVVTRTRGNHDMARNGDSGSPVFFDLGDDVILLGILWGIATSGNPNDFFIYSPIDQIQSEIGPFRTHDFPGCP